MLDYGLPLLASNARTANGTGRCAVCGQLIRRGDRIADLKDGSPVHVACAGRVEAPGG